jgi:cyanophycinase
MSGPIALFGGEEFSEAAEAFDRELLKLVASDEANVAILPTAAQPENPYLAAAHGIAHFRKLGADPYGAMILDRVTADAPMLVTELDGAEVIYLTGGWPAHLLESLRGTLTWGRIMNLHKDGAVLAGSSAGAMVLCDRMRYEDQQAEALNVVSGVTVLPHFERASDERIEKLAESAEPGMTYLGIDGATGCLNVDGIEWHVYGPGRVRVITSGGVETVESGGTFQLS